MAAAAALVRALGLVPILAAAVLPAAAAVDPAPVAPPPSWSFGLGSTAYAYQREDTAGRSSDHVRFHQHFAVTAAGLADGRLAIRAAGRFADTPDGAGPWFEPSRLHTGLLEARLGARVRAEAGRQFLQAGVAGLTLDGARLAWRGRGGATASVWAGAAARADHAWAVADFDQDAAAGAQVVVRPGRSQRLGFSAAYRERRGIVASRPVGLEYVTTAVRGLRAAGRAAYDLEGERWVKLEAQGQWRPAAGRPVVTAQYVDRSPGVDAASWFSRFTGLARIRLARAGVRWESARGWGGEVEWLGSFVGPRVSSRVGMAALLPAARVGYWLRSGDAGDENAVYGEVRWRARPWLCLEGEASHLTYALLADAPADQERDLTTLAVRARAALRPGLDVVAEVQSLRDPVYDKDVRLLVGVDAAMGRGASRFGLDRGGWLR